MPSYSQKAGAVKDPRASLAHLRTIKVAAEKKMDSFYSLVFSEKPAKKFTSHNEEVSSRRWSRPYRTSGIRFPQGTPAAGEDGQPAEERPEEYAGSC
jgi:hypothetical protein